MSSLLTASIGNTRVALGMFDLPIAGPSPQPVLAASFPLFEAEAFSPEFQPAGPVAAAVLASVNPPHDAAVEAWIARRFGVKPLRFPDDVPLLIENRCKPPEAVGADRLANAIAAWHEFGTSCVIVDAGTAVTVDAVSADGPAFCGGAILPGLALWTRTLARSTALLPESRLEESGPAIGRSTLSAISSGTLRGLAGAIDRLVADIARELGGCGHVIITGGDAQRLAPFCKTDMTIRQHLTLTGLALAKVNEKKS